MSDIFEKPILVVHPYGLIKPTTKATVTSKIVNGLAQGQHLYEQITQERMEEFLVQAAFSRDRERHMHIYTGPEGVRQIQRAMQTEVARMTARVDPAMPGSEPTTFSITLNEDWQTPADILHPQITQQQILQTQLRNGDITMFEYLDAISEL